MDPKKSSDMKDTPSLIYYGVFTPNDNKDHNGVPNVFDDKVEALKVAKKNKKSRFKAFQFYHEALEFALNGSEFPNNNTTVNGVPKTETSQAVGEKASPFKGPKPQELVELRKAIENGNVKFVRDIIWQNPRYLVSSGDTPSILQEGPRYNALHVAAKSKNAEIAELILSTISNTEFIKLLYGDDNQQNAEDRTAILLDLYLNTPNKGLNETPLHFASKHGSTEVVEILVSFPQCDKTLRNKFNKLAEQIICERAEGDNIAAAKRKIEMLLKDSYYVPVLRAEDNSMAPLIGEPFSPSKPPVLNSNPLTPRLEIHAYAGPMDQKNAREFRRVWKTPPRSLHFNSPNKTPKDLLNVSSLRFKDPRKGLERIGKRLANEFDVNWKEYWPFLGSFLDISSEEGLDALEKYLQERFADPENSRTEDSNEGAKELNGDEVLSPVSNLCLAFSSCRLSDSAEPQPSVKLDRISDSDSINYLDKACQVFANRISNDILNVFCDEGTVLQNLETQVKQLELLTTSYMEDARFALVNFQKIHSRIGLLIGRKMCAWAKDEICASLRARLENLFDAAAKSVDCFSSDDEGHRDMREPTSELRKPTMRKKQLICLLHYVLNGLSRSFEGDGGSRDECLRDWEEAEACGCVYHARKSNKRNSLSRSVSFKNSGRIPLKNEEENVPRRLSFDDGDPPAVPNGYKLSNGHDDVEISTDEDPDLDEDKFYTPPSSPSLLECESDSDDEFNDTELPKHDIFLEGDCPTKLDCEVFNALCYAEVQLDSKKYPNIYKWHHTVSLYSTEERESWNSHKPKSKVFLNVSLNSSFDLDQPRRTSTPSKSWLRITGANSPKAVVKSRSMHL
ncbi:ankyrin repeat and LEM domain-containing protein 2 [Leptinotarsa decemlineata]|uniref:ankyrin repeat and LEM domain-containing protein 2 n=1 Tax=Leptinotarsa decemlineata TaxID=7539 RepID=UPI003D308B67